MLPSSLKADLRDHLKRVKQQHEEDLRTGNGRVYLPHALSRKYPNAAAEWGWQYAFPAPALSRDPRSGERRRHHLYDRSIQQAFHQAVRRGCRAPWTRSDPAAYTTGSRRVSRQLPAAGVLEASRNTRLEASRPSHGPTLTDKGRTCNPPSPPGEDCLPTAQTST
jgi:hypothetical protein